MTPAPPKNIDAYIKPFPPEVGDVLEKIRAVVHKTAPGGVEKISYGMPAVKLNGRILVYFAAFKKHVGLFPPARGDAAFMRAIAPYSGPKGNLQFQLEKPIPYTLIRKVVQARSAEVLEKTAGKPESRVATTAGARSKTKSGKR